MRRAGVEVGLGVIMRALVLVLDEETNRCAEGDTVLGTGLDLNSVELGARRRDVALAGAPTRELDLDVLVRELESGRDAVDDGADRLAVRLAVRVDAVVGAEGGHGDVYEVERVG